MEVENEMEIFITLTKYNTRPKCEEVSGDYSVKIPALQ